MKNIKNNRTDTVTGKIQTPFGSMYIHIHYDTNNIPVGAWISDPGKEPDSTVSQLVRDLSEGLHELLKENQR